MEAIEFKTIIHNGTVIIPPEYSSQWEGKAIRVIVLNDSEPVEKPKQATFNAISLNTQGFDFNREEANTAPRKSKVKSQKSKVLEIKASGWLIAST